MSASDNTVGRRAPEPVGAFPPRKRVGNLLFGLEQQRTEDFLDHLILSAALQW